MRARILILGGTAEARELATLADAAGLDVVTSFAGRMPAPRRPPGEVRVGGFGGAEGLMAYLDSQQISALVDATHPYAVQISAQAAAACDRLDLARLMLRRPPWTAEPGDRWIEVADDAEAAAALPGLAKRVLLTVGRRALGAYAGLDGIRFFVRLVSPPGDLPLDCQVITGRGPFSLEDERALLTDHAIDGLVSRQSGGPATYGKIAAARERAIPVVMIRRPPLVAGETVETPATALDWLKLAAA
ncbi:MAG TPA: cobalt-precorrin-6A reductase [Alphaproteobacteria bacterium]|jgi:precorrin-6A/cobalt-precorrin-6A reductase|nr:cobalt-precorrin-6A reductase [Alphaproteobacteria bacterium]MDP7428239.1 cobalt-precorrin-6A reductase [Alphaproteobacteria bacterium]HJM50418.1 cobalt-precorrin-6A reductase [Alphaproteobacteria bacterium]